MIHESRRIVEISAIYGDPVVYDNNWFDDSDGYTLKAVWDTNDHGVLLVSRIEEDYSSFGGIRISIK